jgi:NAD(P)-dependent dehydrogenase (short-subunit alcohol dehydrogenase family)
LREWPHPGKQADMSIPDQQNSILVTGASSGIGKASALALLARGFRVFAGVRSERDADRLRDEAPADSHERLHSIELDVTDAAQIEAAAALLEPALGAGGLWGLFNNAGITVNGPLEFVPIDGLRRQLEVNVVGQVAVTQAFLPMLRRARGRILTTGSVAGLITVPGLGPYAMSKHAIESFSDGLRRELRPWGIEVSLLEPGAIATDIWQKGVHEVDELLQDPPPKLKELYGPLIAALRSAAEESERRASPAELVARAVVHAFTARRPKTRYCLGRDSSAQKWISRLPDRWTDSILLRVLGLR